MFGVLKNKVLLLIFQLNEMATTIKSFFLDEVEEFHSGASGGQPEQAETYSLMYPKHIGELCLLDV